MIKNTSILFVALLLAGSTFAEWRLVDDGEIPATLDNWTVTSDNTDYPGGIPGSLEYVDDPVASGQGKVLEITIPSGTARFAAHSSIIYPLGDLAIKDDLLDFHKKQTVYFKLLRPLVDGLPGQLDTTIGLMSSAEWAKQDGVTLPPKEPDNIPVYFNYSSIVRYENDGIFDVWDGGTPTYLDCSDTAQETNVWYEVWMVHSHGVNTYQVYLKGGSDFPDQTLVTKEAIIDEYTTHFKGNTAHYRVNTFEDLDWFMIRPNGGGPLIDRGRDNTYIDDFYIDNDGENLFSPANDPIMGGEPVEGLPGWYLSDWFGYYNTDHAPWLFHAEHGFVFRYSESSSESTYFYDNSMGAWWWTGGENEYPYLFRFSDGVWLWYQERSKDPRWFLKIDSGTWESR